MMDKNKEKWIEEVLNSMDGSKRAKPNTDLFRKIETQVLSGESKIIPIRMQRVVAMAASLLLFLNVFAWQQFVQARTLNSSELLVEESSSENLISDYNIYK